MLTRPSGKRVGILVRSSLWGGLETHAADLARVLRERGCHPILLCGDDRTADMFKRQLDGSIPIETVPAYGLKAWVALARSLRHLELEACVFEKGALHAGSLAFDVCARLTCRRLITIQQLAPPALPPESNRRVFGIRSPNLWRRRMIWRGKLRSLFPNVTVCVSDAVADRLRDDYRFAARRLVTVRNGVDVDRFQEDGDARRRLRAEWETPDGTLLFGAVSRLVPEKGLDLCLEAFCRVARDPTLRPVRLVIVGDGPERPRLEQIVQRSGLGDRVLFAGFRSDIPAVLSSIDVLVLSSRLEGLPLTVLEALSVGRPVVATRVNGTPEIFTRENLGWLVAPNDPEELALALRAAANQTDEHSAMMRATARRHMVEQFNAHREYARFQALIEG